MYSQPLRFACRHPFVFVRSRAFQPLNKKKERKRQREKGVGSLALPTRANHRCHPFIAWSNSRQSSLLPVNHPEAISPPPSMHLRSPFITPLPHHVRVNNTPILCAPRKARFLSKWIHDEFLFRGLNARGSRFSPRFSLSLALCRPLPPPSPTTSGRPFSFSRQSVGHAAMLNVKRV